MLNRKWKTVFKDRKLRKFHGGIKVETSVIFSQLFSALESISDIANSLCNEWVIPEGSKILAQYG